MDWHIPCSGLPGMKSSYRTAPPRASLWLLLAALGGTSAALAGTPAVGAAAVEAARTFLQAAMADHPGEARVRVSPLDSRLRLEACPGGPEPFLAPGSRLLGSLTVGIRCPAAGWTVYTAARVDVAAPVLVAARPLLRGDSLGPGDLRLDRRELAALPGGYLTGSVEITGKRLRRGLRAGAVITPSMLESIPLVQRGETVTLLYDSGGFEVRAEGTALEDAGVGEHLRIRSHSSQRVVHGKVGAERVVTMLR